MLMKENRNEGMTWENVMEKLRFKKFLALGLIAVGLASIPTLSASANDLAEEIPNIHQVDVPISSRNSLRPATTNRNTSLHVSPGERVWASVPRGTLVLVSGSPRVVNGVAWVTAQVPGVGTGSMILTHLTM